MKRLLWLYLLLIFPFNVLAYSEYVIPGGETIGINIKNNGVLVVGFYKTSKNFKNNIRIGDYIIKVNNKDVYNIDDLINTISNEVNNKRVTLTINRNGENMEIPFTLTEENNTYKTGLYVKDNITGIGTLTYIDPNSNIYGALGHEVIESTTNKLVEVREGTIFRSSITSIDKSIDGVAGTKNARFYSKEIYGDIIKNTNKGIFGTYNTLLDKEMLKVGSIDDIKVGKAYIYTVLTGENVKPYEIYIDDVKDGEIKNIHFTITSEELISKTGGVVQGMSGSPIIQNDMIIGAVTHVIVDNPTTGYGILITNMLEEGER